MNDIGVKTAESPKDISEISPAPEISVDNEVDPLSLEDTDVVTGKDPLKEGDNVVEEKRESCDDNAKEDNISESPNDETIAVQPETIKEVLLKDEAPITVIEVKDVADDVAISLKPDQAPENTASCAPETSELPQETKQSVDVPKVEEPSPVKETPVEVEEVKPQKADADVEMTEVVQSSEKTEKTESKINTQALNGDVIKEEQTTKRRISEDVDTESPLKKLCQEVEKTFPQHDVMISDYIQTATKNNVDEIQRHTEQLLSEIQTLRELAQKKEHEWNNILHLKKVKEEILLRLLRRKQVISFEKSADVNGSERTDPFDYLNQAKNLAIDKSDEISGLAIKQPSSTMVNPILQAPVLPVTTHFNHMSGLPPPYDKAAHMQSMPKPVFHQPLMLPGPLPGFSRDMNGQLNNFGMPMGRQGPTKDVKSIIADYRQRNPEVTPRRGRRMKSILNPNMMNPPRPIAPKIDNLNNFNNLNMLFNNLDMNQKAMLERLQQIQAGGLPNGVSFKDVLVQFANMQQTNPNLMPSRPMEMPSREHHVRPEGRRRQDRSHEEPHIPKQAERLTSPSPRLPPPPPYPEISLLPVTTSQETSQSQSSLLHGILTKNCGEITITPVQPAPPPDPQPEKTEEVVHLDDEESPASECSGAGSPLGSGSGRLVIDEGGEAGAEAEAEAGEGAAEAEAGAPLCQGCRRRDAQFVCAGCANQWYCSRDCQVAAWDDHSEMCSG
ncbi:PREDICTED: uncharacterized protein LOC106108840 isoform X3 [Papilio polytes]|uniref:uncharacterized protein LOC106108840 isoform X3 n=1 Tax=Papilio polytes TaxID=76194 RepID=UPI000675F030|nr:PREDICTED: uncharacterized protein LOC106108840 isoform X3 [Papilio polytes]